MASSPARLAANAANAQHSTGPRTPEGRAVSSQNARTHGLTASDLIVAPDEREEFEELLNAYTTEVQPQGRLQQTFFDALVEAAWNLIRIRRAEAKLCANIPCLDLLDDEVIQKKLERLARHKTRIERTFHHSLKELKALQTNAVLVAILPESVRKKALPLSDASEISKRTHQFGDGTALQLLDALNEAPPPIFNPIVGQDGILPPIANRQS
jgi:hypothetical protein